jgi:dTDP-4-amino-4,6-dideoxygalactose transaminase
LSFHPVKHVTTGEGGAILTNDAKLAVRLRELRSHGIHREPARLTRLDEGPWYYEQVELGYHYRITDLECALGLSQLNKLERFLDRRNEIAVRYDTALAGSPLAGWLAPLRTQPTTARHAYHLYVVRLVRRAEETLDQLAARRLALYQDLRTRSIATQVHYIPVTEQPYYCDRKDEAGDGARAFYAGCLSLPMFPKMTDAEVDRVISALTESVER